MRQGIVLVDGIQLTHMMLKYKVGAQTHKIIELLESMKTILRRIIFIKG